MQINKLKARKLKNKKRVGRGGANGTYSGKGMKGQKSRSGYSRRSTWEGGRTTLIEATKKNRGFKSRQAKNQVVGSDILEKKFKDGSEITPQSLKKNGLIKDISVPVKILNKGKISKKFTFKNVLVSASVKKEIEKAGGEMK
jgi:large subunit ribosomal protein L15